MNTTPHLIATEVARFNAAFSTFDVLTGTSSASKFVPMQPSLYMPVDGDEISFPSAEYDDRFKTVLLNSGKHVLYILILANDRPCWLAMNNFTARLVDKDTGIPFYIIDGSVRSCCVDGSTSLLEMLEGLCEGPWTVSNVSPHLVRLGVNKEATIYSFNLD